MMLFDYIFVINATQIYDQVSIPLRIQFIMMRDYSFKLQDQNKDYSYRIQDQQPSRPLNLKSSNASIRLEQIRKKYDTPTRRQLQEYNLKNSFSRDNEHKGYGGMNKQEQRKSNGLNQSLQSSRGRQTKLYSKYDENGKQNFRKEEESVFEKIKEMKQSIMGRSSLYEKPSNHREVPKDYRIDNIDKINTKIKQILDCLHEGERPKREQKNLETSQLRTPMTNEGSNFGRSSGKPQPRTNLTKFEIKQSSSVYQEKKNIQSSQKEKEKSINSFNMMEKEKTINRSKSVMTYGKKGAIQTQSGKKLDDEITKIEQKIKQFEDEKRKLNISFTPYKHSASRSVVGLPSKIETPKNEQPSKYQPKLDRSTIYDMESFEKRERQRVKQRISSKNIYDIEKEQISLGHSGRFGEVKPEIPEKQSSFQIKLIPVQHQKSHSSFANQNFERQANNGIEERKKRLQHWTGEKKSKENLSDLTKYFGEQAKLDEVLRNNKIWLQSDLKRQKWQTIQSLLPSKMKMDLQKVRSKFTITQAQNNPFFSVRESGCTYQQVIESFVSSQEYWNSHISKKFNKRELEREGLNLDCIDLQRKGYIVVEDLVRFLNMQTGTFFRNRDIVLIFRRMTGGQRLSYQQFLNSICD